MKLKPIITSLLDTDLYKFNMNQVIFHKHTDLVGEYHFKCRTPNIFFTKEMVTEINDQIDHLCSLRFKNEELNYLRSIRFIKPDYVEFLRLWHPIKDYVTTVLENEELRVIVSGPLFSAMQFEIYLLEIINEVYFRMKFNYDELLVSAKEKLEKKILDFKNKKYNFKFAEFGCRSSEKIIQRNSRYGRNFQCIFGNEIQFSANRNLCTRVCPNVPRNRLNTAILHKSLRIKRLV